MQRDPKMSFLRAAGIAAVFTLLSASNSPAAPQLHPETQNGQPAAAPNSPTVFKADVRRVVLDVVVTDAQGKPVPGLTQQDFSIKEDGAPQRVLSFDANGFDPAMDYTPPKLPVGPPNTFVNLPATPEKGPLYVLLYDLVNMDNEDQMGQTVNQHEDQIFGRQQLIKFIQSKPEGTRFAIFVRSDGLHLVQGFTSDKQQLFAALDPRHPAPHMPRVFLLGQNYDRGDDHASLDVMKFLVGYLDGLPGRKNLIWFSGGFPLNLFPTVDDVPSYAAQIRQTLDLMTREQIAIYPVDVRGVVTTDWKGAIDNVGGEGKVVSQRYVGSPGGPGMAPGDPNAPGIQSPDKMSAATGGGLSLIASSYQVEDELARDTGGRAFYGTNEVADALARATENGETYYTLTYSPTDKDYQGKQRRIEVDLAKKGYTLQYRRAYFGTDTDAPPPVDAPIFKAKAGAAPPRKPGDTLYANMEHGAPTAHQLVFGARLRTVGAPAMGTPAQMAELSTQPAYFKLRRKSASGKALPPVALQRYVIDYTVMAHQLQLWGQPLNLELAAAAYDADGHMLNSLVNNGASDSPAAAAALPAARSYRAEQQLDVPLNAASIRVAVRDANTDRIGAMEIKLPLAPENESASATKAN
jgi:VWFA-related protein